jgi:hypothetical protein
VFILLVYDEVTRRRTRVRYYVILEREEDGPGTFFKIFLEHDDGQDTCSMILSRVISFFKGTTTGTHRITHTTRTHTHARPYTRYEKLESL